MKVHYQLNPEQKELKLLKTPKVFTLTRSTETGEEYFKIANFRAEQIIQNTMFPKSTFIWFELCYRADIDTFYIKRFETRYDEDKEITFNGVFARSIAKNADNKKYVHFAKGNKKYEYTIEEINALPVVQSENLVGYTSTIRKELLAEAQKILINANYYLTQNDVLDKRTDIMKTKNSVSPETIQQLINAINNFASGKRTASLNTIKTENVA